MLHGSRDEMGRLGLGGGMEINRFVRDFGVRLKRTCSEIGPAVGHWFY